MNQSIPPHGAPHYDTRENERPDICCECNEDPDTCGNCIEDCKQAAEKAIAEDLFEAWREAYE